MNIWHHFLYWNRIAKNAYTHIMRNDLTVVAAGISFYFLLAIFPAIGLGFAMWTLFASKAMFMDSTNAILGIVPPDARHILQNYITQLIAQREEGVALTLHGLASFFIALYSSASGAKALMRGLNIAYDYDEKRNFLRFNLISLGLTLILIFMLFSAFGLILVLPVALNLLGLSPMWLPLLSGPFLLVGFALFLWVIYNVAPDHESHKGLLLWPGCLFSVTTWIIASTLFATYASNFGAYDKTYGALGGVVVLLFWLWITFLTILAGADINARYRDARKH